MPTARNTGGAATADDAMGGAAPSSEPVLVHGDKRDAGEDTDDDGFVVVTQPMATMRQFTDWMRKVRLPSAAAVMQGQVGEGDTIQALVARRTFIQDLLQSFRGRINDAGSVGADAWPRLWAQFVRDLPRETVLIDGEPLAPLQTPTDGGAATFADSREVEERVLPQFRDFVTRRIPPTLLDVDVWRKRMAEHQKRNRSPGGKSGVWQVAAYLNPWSLIFHPGSEAEKSGEGVSNDSLANFQAAPPGSEDDVIESFTRLAVLMCQQSVLALPLQIITEEFCAVDPDADGEDAANLIVGELSRSDPLAKRGGTRIQFTSTPGKAHGALLTASKVLRVFALADSTDYTLFYVEARVELDLFGAADDDVSLQWRVIPADQPTHSSAAASPQPEPESPAAATAEPQVQAQQQAESTSRRKCECLGASSGYHKPACQYYRPS